jgi:hypothetical protein
VATHEAQIRNLIDQQYKFINEAVLALFQTTNEGKMELLRNAISNSLVAFDMPSQEAVFLSRIIRDISVEEADFLVSSFRFERIWLNNTDVAYRDVPTLDIKPDTSEGRAALGLLTLGLLTTAEPTFDETDLLRFTPMAGKLIALLKPTRA